MSLLQKLFNPFLVDTAPALPILFRPVQRLVRILEDVLAGVVTVGEGYAYADGDLRKAVVGAGQFFIDGLNFLLDGIAQVAGHLHHDDGELVAADTTDEINASEHLL